MAKDSSSSSLFKGSNVQLTLKTPLAKDVLIFVSMRGQEQLSQLYSYELTMYSNRPQDVKIEAVLGHSITVMLKDEDHGEYCFSGMVSQFSFTHALEGRSFFKATLVPKAWLMTRQGENTFWENQKISDVIKDVLSKQGLVYSVADTKVQYKHLLQYCETHFDLVSRLMEEEGLYYYFEHETDNQKWHIVDSENPAAQKITFNIDACEVTHSQQIQPNAMTLYGWDYKKKQSVKKPSGSYPDQGLKERKLEDYVGVSMNSDEHPLDTKDYSKIRMEQLQSEVDVAHGTLHGALLSGPGAALEFSGYPCDALNKKYLITSVVYEIEAPETGTDRLKGVELNCGFTAIDAAKPFRPARTTPKPMIQGPQAAIVKDTKDPDGLGRVKVKYPWMEKNSWWIRVAQIWAGKDHGAVFIPQVEDEVVVDFQDGDPNQPIIIGSVYNGKDKPPEKNSPEHRVEFDESKGDEDQFDVKAEHLIRSLSGSEIRFIDKEYNEQVYIYGKKDLKFVASRNRMVYVEEGDEKVIIEKGNQETTLNEGDQAITLEKGDHKLEVKDDEGKSQIIAGDSIELKVGSNSIKITKTDIQLKVGDNTVKLENAGITIKGMQISVDGDLKTEVKGAMVDVNGAGATNVKGGIVMIN